MAFMTSFWAVDYSFARPDPSQIAAQGYSAVLRYLSPPPNDKNLYAAERDRLRAAGLAIGLVWETSATRPRNGYTAGQADAYRANAYADELGYPRDCTIWYASDEIVAFGLVQAYYQGVKDLGGRPWAPYGTEAIVDGCWLMGSALGWQVSTWDDGVGPRISPHAGLVQEANIPADIPGTDVNSIRYDNWGGWAAPGQEQEDALMAVTVAEFKALSDQVTQIAALVTDLHARMSERKAGLLDKYEATTGDLAASVLAIVAKLDTVKPGGITAADVVAGIRAAGFKLA